MLYVLLRANLDLQVARTDLEQKNASLVKVQDELTRQLSLIQAQHEQLLALSAPILKVAPRVLALPIIGTVDLARARQMTEALLTAVVSERASSAIIDLTGMWLAGSEVAAHLLRMVEAVQLLGSRCILTGLSPELARALANDLRATAALDVFADLQGALDHVSSPRAAGSGRGERSGLRGRSS